MQDLPPPTQGRVNYDSFDGLRGIAAMAVAFFHLAPHAGLEWIMPHGYLAVDLFFVLSGFVIAQAYGARLKAGMGLRQFMAVRLVRLYPLYFLGQVLGFWVLIVTDHELLAVVKAFLAGILLLPIPVQHGGIPLIFSLNGPSWSLFFEIAINLAFVFLVMLSRKRMLCLIAASAVALVATSVRFGGLDVGWNLYNFLGGLPRVAFSFLAGVFLLSLAPRLRAGNLVPALLMLLVLVILTAAPRGWWFDALVVLFVLPIIVLAAAAWQPAGVMARLCRQLGRISYSIYIIHAPLLYLGSWLIETWHLPAGLHLLAWIAIYAAILLLAELAVSLYDQPVRRALPRALELARSFRRPA